MLEDDKKWSDIKACEELVVGGTCYSLAHLRDAEYRFRIPASGRYPELEIIILVIFGSHCISWGPSRGEEIDFGAYGEDHRIIDEKGVHRCFDAVRYALSLHLPGIFRTFVERDCLFTGRGNWLMVEVLDPAGERREYEVFFRIFRQSNHALRIFVYSAYVRNPQRSRKRPRPAGRHGKVSAKILMAKTLRGEPVRQPAGKRGDRP